MPEMSWSGDFSYGFYETLVAAAAECFDIRPLADHLLDPPATDTRRLYWRHDVDVCLAAARGLAELDSKLGIRATYMFIPNSPLYDLTCPHGRAALKAIKNLGHELALHFDVEASGVTPGQLENDDLVGDAIANQLQEFQDLTGDKIYSVSFHRPVKKLLRGPETIAERVNGYAAKLMNFYISDSGGVWRQGHPIADIEATDCTIGQVLTHPIWWGPDHVSAKDRLETFYRARTKEWPAEEKARFDANMKLALPSITREGLSAL